MPVVSLHSSLQERFCPESDNKDLRNNHFIDCPEQLCNLHDYSNENKKLNDHNF